MTFRSILPRVLLSLALVLNGANTAVAASHMQFDVDAHSTITPSAATPRASVDAMPCQHHQAATPATPGDASTIGDPAPAGSKHPAHGCCKSDDCRCPCMHAGQAALPPATITVVLVDHDRGVRRLLTVHVAPAPPHLIRPPIG